MDRAVDGVDVRNDISAKGLTTICVGGVIKRLYGVHSVLALRQLLVHERESDHTVRCLGAGSNSLFPDNKFVSPVVQLVGEFRGIRRLNERVFSVGAGVSLMRLARQISSEGLSGLEFAGGIPASLGGAVCMNAGAHGGDIGSRIVSIDCMTPDGEVVTLKERELSFQYRKSNLPPGWIILSTTLRFEPSDPTRTSQQLAENLAFRKRTQPLTVPSFGSTFQNPLSEDENVLPTAGELIEQVGLKGARVGGAEISRLHANWVVNPERTATAADVRALLELVQTKVLKERAVSLHPEVIDWSSFNQGGESS